MTQDEIKEIIAKVYGVVWINNAQLRDLTAFAKLVAEKQQCTWVDLTDEESVEIQKISNSYEQAVELTKAKLKEKNT